MKSESRIKEAIEQFEKEVLNQCKVDPFNNKIDSLNGWLSALNWVLEEDYNENN